MSTALPPASPSGTPEDIDPGLCGRHGGPEEEPGERRAHPREAGCRMLLATKAFAMPAVFPLMRELLDGTTASGQYEARLGREEFGKEVHVYAPAYTESTHRELLRIADHIYFNSATRSARFLPAVKSAGKDKKVGIRINPGYSNATLGGELYDPCSPCSRFGVVRARA